MRLGNRSTKKKQKGAKFEDTLPLLKTVNFKVININQYSLKYLNFVFLSPVKEIETVIVQCTSHDDKNKDKYW